MGIALFSFVVLVVFVQLFVSTSGSPFIVGITYDLSRKNYLVTLNPATGMPTANVSDKDYLDVMVGTADLKNQLYYYIYSIGEGPGILRAFDLHTLSPNGSKTIQDSNSKLPGDVPSDMFWDSQFGLLGFWMSPTGECWVGSIDPESGKTKPLVRSKIAGYTDGASCYDAVNHRYFIDALDDNIDNILMTMSLPTASQPNGTVVKISVNDTAEGMQYDPVTDTLVGFNSNGSIVQVDVTTGESTFRVSQAPWPVPSIYASYSAILDPVGRKYYSSLIHFEKAEWLVIDMTSWTTESILNLTPPMTYAHVAWVPA